MTDPFAMMVGDLSDAFNEPTVGGVLVLPLAEVKEDPDNVRDDFDPESLAGLAASIKARGVLQPIIVRPKGEDGLYMIRFGARRYRASVQAGMPTIRALIGEGEGDEADFLADQIIENDQRVALSTAQMARGVGRLIELGMKPVDISRKLGRSKDDISRYAAVLKMPERLRALGNVLGITTLTALHRAYKQNPEAVERYLDATAAIDITQADARRLSTPVAEKPKVGSTQLSGSAIDDGPRYDIDPDEEEEGEHLAPAQVAGTPQAKSDEKVGSTQLSEPPIDKAPETPRSPRTPSDGSSGQDAVPPSPALTLVIDGRTATIADGQVTVLFDGDTEPTTLVLKYGRPVPG